MDDRLTAERLLKAIRWIANLDDKGNPVEDLVGDWMDPPYWNEEDRAYWMSYIDVEHRYVPSDIAETLIAALEM